MKGFYLFVILGFFALAGCRREEDQYQPQPKPIELVGPNITSLTPVNSGKDLNIRWTSVEGAKGYRVYCDGNKIWEGTDTTHTIDGFIMVCREIVVSAYNSSEEKGTSIDLSPKFSVVNGLVSHDSPTGNSWVKLDFNTGMAYSVRISDVDRNAPNVGWFLFYNSSGTLQFRDASETSIGTAMMEVAFTASNSSGNLAPGTGNYNTVIQTANNAYHFFWADNTSTKPDSMDNSDYFGVIKVTSISGSGPYTANLEIYIQIKVPGLRWVKF